MQKTGFILIQTLLILIGISALLIVGCIQVDESIKQLKLEQEGLQLESLVRAAAKDCQTDETLRYPIGTVTCTRTDNGFKMKAVLDNGQGIEAIVSDG